MPESEDIYSARITRIDGDSASSVRDNRHQLPVGRHTLTVSEAIDANRLSTAQLTQMRKMKKFAHADAYKQLVVEVKPGVSHRIGARLHRDRLDTLSIKNNAYWEPVVWEEVAQSCP